MGRVIGIVLFVFLLCSCRTVYVPEVHTDTLIVNKYERDSVFIETLKHDSVTIREKGDSVIIDRWHTQYVDRWREREVHDTLVSIKVDSVSVPYPVEKKVSFWARAKMYTSAFLVGCAVSGVVLWIRRRYKRC